MSSIDSTYLAHFERLLWEDSNCVVVSGDIAAVLRGRAAYHRELDIPLPETVETDRLVWRMLAAAGIAAVLLSRRESWGWTLTLPGLPIGLFCGVEPDGRICAVVRQADRARATAVLQRQRQGGPLVQSHIEVPGQDPVSVVEKYFLQVEQTPTRVAVDESGRAALIQALPGSDLDDLLGLTQSAMVERVRVAHAEGKLRRVEEVLLFYACRCSEELVLQTLLSLPDEQRRELWMDETQIEVECPRCARRYHIRRQSV